jgi:raffinose/stachyose/melibiose transport system permease protein
MILALMKNIKWNVLAIHLVLLSYTALALFPTLLMLLNSLKSREAIFGSPLALPTPQTFDLSGYQTVFSSARFDLYFLNSLLVTTGSLSLILLVSSGAAWALARYSFTGSGLLGLYLSLGIMVPIRLGTISLLKLMVTLKLTNTLWALILVYTAGGIPLAVFILTQFFKQVPRELEDAAKMDGASEYQIFWLLLPLVRPALGTVAVFNMIPIWNDLWFPLILAPSEKSKTVILGAQIFLGQFINDWNAVLAALTLAIMPIMILYIIFSKQLIRGLTQGAVK